MIRHCPTCEMTSDKIRFVGEFCENCATEKVAKGFPSSAKIYYCNRCGTVNTGAGEKIRNRKKAMEIVLSRELSGSKCSIALQELREDAKEADVEVTCPVGDDYVKFGKTVKVALIRQICKTCLRKSYGYYEAVVQARGEAAKVEKLVEKISKYLAHVDGFIAKKEKMGNGLDLYVSDKLALREFLMKRRIKSKASYTLYGIKNGRKVYRDTYFIDLDAPRRRPGQPKDVSTSQQS